MAWIAGNPDSAPPGGTAHFITGHGDISMCAQAMKAGAVDFLPKPFRGDDLLGCVERALIRSAEQRRRGQKRMKLRTFLVC